jgi:hypothetical protein
MAFETLQLRWAACQIVALCAVRRPTQLLVGSRKRTGGDLCAGGSNTQDKHKKEKDRGQRSERQLAGPIRFV